MGHFIWFSFSSSFDLPGSQSIFDASEDPPMSAHASLSQDGSYHKGLWVDHPLTSLPFDLQGAFLCLCGRAGLLTWRMREMWPGQGPASCLNCPAILVLEFQSQPEHTIYSAQVRGFIYLLIFQIFLWLCLDLAAAGELFIVVWGLLSSCGSRA